MKIQFIKDHTLKENRTSYKKGDTLEVSSSIATRLVDAGIAKEAEVKDVAKTEPKPKESK